MLRNLYLTYGVATLLGYSALAGFGYELSSPPRSKIANPQTVRSSPGGFRSYSFWHTGLHGGK